MILRTPQTDEITISRHGDKTIVVDPSRSGAKWLALTLFLSLPALILMIVPAYLGSAPRVAGLLLCAGMVSVVFPLMSFFRFLRVRRVASRLVIGPTKCVYTRYEPYQTRSHEFPRSDYGGLMRRDNGDLFAATVDGLLPFHRGLLKLSGKTTHLNRAIASQISEGQAVTRTLFENDHFRLLQIGPLLICEHAKNDSPVFELFARPDGVVLRFDEIVRHKCPWNVNPRLILQDYQLFFVGDDQILRILAHPDESRRELAGHANDFMQMHAGKWNNGVACIKN